MDMMSVIPLVGNAISTLNTVREVRDDALRQSAINKVQTELGGVLAEMTKIIGENLALQQEKAQLQRELQAERDARAKDDRYRLEALPSGAMVLRYQRTEGDSTGNHLACARCHAETGKHFPLQPSMRASRRVLVCRKCGIAEPELPIDPGSRHVSYGPSSWQG